MDGPHSAWELEIRQLVMLGLVGLIAGQGQGLVFVRETLKYSKVHKLLIVNLNLERQECRGRRVRGSQDLWPHVSLLGQPA